ncbi:MAG: SEC-C domain-containing protein, partial [Deltaproteobacteria bacterium]|nr:SEC-C domain-containing protein [Deltaproteobacteria bacterium]
EGKDLKEEVLDLIDVQADAISQSYGPESRDDFDWQPALDRVYQLFNLKPDPKNFSGDLHADSLGEWIYDQVIEAYEAREKELGEDLVRHVEKVILLQTLDQLWKDHLLSMDHLREGIGLKGYAQQDPILAYKKEGYDLFQSMMDSFGEDSLAKLFRVEVREPSSLQQAPGLRAPVQESHGGTSAFPNTPSPQSLPGLPQTAPQPEVTGSLRREAPKVGRNDPCPCGSGKKYKKCHGS